MAGEKYYNAGTASATAGSKTVSFSGISVAKFGGGYVFRQGGASEAIASVDTGAGTITLINDWAGATTVNQPYSVTIITDGAAMLSATQELLDRFSGSILTIAAMTGDTFPSNGKIIYALDGDWATATLGSRITAEGAMTLGGTLTGPDSGTWSSSGLASLKGLGVTNNQNEATAALVTNTSGGTGAAARWSLSNGTSTGSLSILGTGYTTSGIRLHDFTVLESSFGISLVSAGSILMSAGGATTDGLRLTSTNAVCVGVSDPISSANMSVQNVGNALAAYSTGTATALTGRVDSTGSNFAQFVLSSTQIGTIKPNSGGTATQYNTSSDARLKDGIEDAQDSGAIIDGLRVRTWRWKSNGDQEAFGFVAQELVEVAPFAVSPGDDNPDTIVTQWQRDDSKLVPLLVKEVQCLRLRVSALEGAE